MAEKRRVLERHARSASRLCRILGRFAIDLRVDAPREAPDLAGFPVKDGDRPAFDASRLTTHDRGSGELVPGPEERPVSRYDDLLDLKKGLDPELREAREQR